MAAEPIKVSPQQAFDFAQNFFRTATRKTNVTSQREHTRMMVQSLQLTPQSLGAWSKRISVDNQFSKSIYQRFIDVMS